MSSDQQTAGDQPFPDPGHDHGSCLGETLDHARRAFSARGLRFTPLRERVLTEIAASHHAIGAYDVLDRMAEGGERMAPISVYRAIEALVDAGVVHRLESRNAYFACHIRHRPGTSALVLVCERCGAVAEIADETSSAAIGRAVADAGFSARSAVCEVIGACSHCKEDEAS
ncbi:MAG: transcriptional repressor [Hyphomicrobiaceae bacterium]